MVTATIDNVISFAGTRSVEVDRLPIERRRFLLTWLARHLMEVPGELVDFCVLALARHHPDLDYRFTDFCERLALADAADQGVLDWRQVDDTLTCSERTETAREIARQDADAALAILIGSAR